MSGLPSKCFWCPNPALVPGLLCEEHQNQLRNSVTITPEQIRRPMTEATSCSLIDSFGRSVPIGEQLLVGREDTASGLAVLHHSVSLVHAYVENVPEGLRVVDQASLNGTLVNGELVEEPTLLFDGDTIHFGEIGFFVTTQIAASDISTTHPGATIPVPSVAVPFARKLRLEQLMITLAEKPPGGTIRSELGTIKFSKMEFSLLRVLAEEHDHSAFVLSQTIATSLDFRSIEAGSDNVRELVRRIRRKAKANGIESIISSRVRQGYRLARP